MDSNGGHLHIFVENIDDKHVSVGLTTDNKKGNNHPNIKLERSPIRIKEGEKSYIRRQGTVDLINSYVKPRKGEITNGDYEKVKKIGEKAKNKYLSEKDKKNK